MPPKQSDLPPTGSTPSTEVETWHKIRQYFVMHLRDIKMVRKTDFKKAELEQEREVKGIEDLDAWERMFLEGQLRDPKASEVIEDARISFFKFLAPLPTPTEERLGELRQMKQKLLEILRKAQAQCKTGLEKKLPANMNLYLKEAFKLADSYNDLAHSSPEARELIENIIVTIGEIARLTK